MILFLSTLLLCGLYDLKNLQIPLWSILLLNIIGIGMYALHHPVLSISVAICATLLCLKLKIGAADKMIFPIVAGSFGIEGLLLIVLVICISVCYARITASSTPGVLVLSIVSILAMIGGI